MSEYTPTTEDVRGDYMAFAYTSTGMASFDSRGEFDRWLAEHDRQVAEKALIDAHHHEDCPATVEPEWEYQWGEPGETLEGLDPYATYEEARSAMRKESDYESHRVMRRRKADAWEPVEGEANV